MLENGPREKKCCKEATACLNTRAVHIEIVRSMDKDASVAAVTRFIARRRKPEKFIIKNGTNFAGAAREFK